MKRILMIALALMMAIGMAACSKNEAPAASEPTQAPASDAAAPDAAATDDAAATVLAEPIAEEPALLTSAGQSADIEMVRVMMEKNEIRVITRALATPEDLEGCKTLMLAIGGSSKGLGAAGIDADQELERVKELLAAAEEKGIVILAVHIGGEARRGALSDVFITPCFEVADYSLVVEAGDKDGLMSGLAADKGIPYVSVANMSDAIAPLKDVFIP